MVVFGNNVCWDAASAYEWRELNETLYLTRVFEALRELMGGAFDGFTFHIFSAQKAGRMPASAAVVDPRKVLLYISDETGAEPMELQGKYFAIFKPYLRRELPGTNIYPLNIGYVRETPEFSIKPPGERQTELFFCGNLNDNRLPIYAALHPVLRLLPARLAMGLLRRAMRGGLPAWLPRDFSNRRNCLCFTDGFKRGFTAEEYGRVLADSRIALCPKGFHSAETFRHMEALRAGCAVISEPLPDTYCYRNSPILIAPNWHAGILMARALARDADRLSDLQARSLEWWKNVCSERATAAYIRDTLAVLAAGC